MLITLCVVFVLCFLLWIRGAFGMNLMAFVIGAMGMLVSACLLLGVSIGKWSY